MVTVIKNVLMEKMKKASKRGSICGNKYKIKIVKRSCSKLSVLAIF
jgi:hypothetical protein